MELSSTFRNVLFLTILEGFALDGVTNNLDIVSHQQRRKNWLGMRAHRTEFFPFSTAKNTMFSTNHKVSGFHLSLPPQLEFELEA